MAITTLTKTAAPGGYAAAGAAVTLAAVDAVDGGQFAAQGNDLVVIRNSGATPHTYTITSTADRFGRTRDISGVTIAAGAVHVVGPLPLEGWVQSNGRINVSANSTEVLFGVVTLGG